ncbi:MAG: hypothetical protein P4M01_04575 [Acidobacteriota bacterium]|nr:hypothetical protein [Acidobacteriota bacterium]
MKIRGLIAVLLLSAMTVVAQDAPKADDHAMCTRNKSGKMTCCKKDKQGNQKMCCKKNHGDKKDKSADSDNK